MSERARKLYEVAAHVESATADCAVKALTEAYPSLTEEAALLIWNRTQNQGLADTLATHLLVELFIATDEDF